MVMPDEVRDQARNALSTIAHALETAGSSTMKLSKPPVVKRPVTILSHQSTTTRPVRLLSLDMQQP